MKATITVQNYNVEIWTSKNCQVARYNQALIIDGWGRLGKKGTLHNGYYETMWLALAQTST